MADLTRKGSHEFWSKFLDPKVYRAIVMMETAESWTLDQDPEVDMVITALGKKMAHLENVEIDDYASIIELIAYIKTSRNLRFLQALDHVMPGTASKTIGYAEENQLKDPNCKVFIERNILFERFRILSRVFQMDRIENIKKALEAV
jgi:hypothetical protein